MAKPKSLRGRHEHSHIVEIERQLPQNLEAERSVIGAILIDNKYLAEAREILTAADFFLEAQRRQSRPHGVIFSEMIRMGENEKPIDLVTLTDSLHQGGNSKHPAERPISRN